MSWVETVTDEGMPVPVRRMLKVRKVVPAFPSVTAGLLTCSVGKSSFRIVPVAEPSAMVAAAFGLLPPAAGALLQEGIDVAVILNALRALLPARDGVQVLTPTAEELVHRFAAEHDDLREVVEAVRAAADRLSQAPQAQARESVEQVHRLLTERLLPHEHAEERRLYPALADSLGGPETTATMSRAHAEIDRLADRIATHLTLTDADGGLRPENLDDLRACLYGLYGVLRLHFDQEEENYFSLAP